MESNFHADSFMKAISFHDFLHGFVEKRGTGTATLEAKQTGSPARDSFMKAISFHDFLHGFVEKRGTGTATLVEAKQTGSPARGAGTGTSV